MNRRSFLKILGLAPLAPIAAKLPAIAAPIPRINPSWNAAFYGFNLTEIQKRICENFARRNPYAEILGIHQHPHFGDKGALLRIDRGQGWVLEGDLA